MRLWRVEGPSALLVVVAVLGGAAACQPHDATVGAVGLDAAPKSADASSRPADALVTFSALYGDYFNGIEFDGLKGTFEDESLDLLADAFRPVLISRGVDPTTLSVRWRGQLRLRYAETYTLTLVHTGRVRLWLGDRLVIDAWVMTADILETPGMTTGLLGGEWYDLKIEWDLPTGEPNIRLWYSSKSQAEAIVPAQDFRHIAGQ